MNHDRRMEILNRVGTGLVVRPGQQRRYWVYLEGVDVETSGGYLHRCLSAQADTVESGVEDLFRQATGLVDSSGRAGTCLREASGTRGRRLLWDPEAADWSEIGT